MNSSRRPIPIGETLDGDEVEPLHQREADDPVHDEERQLVARDPESARSSEEDECREAGERARGAELGEPQVRDPASVRITFETVPSTANSADAAVTIAYPRRWSAGHRPGARRGARRHR